MLHRQNIAYQHYTDGFFPVPKGEDFERKAYFNFKGKTIGMQSCGRMIYSSSIVSASRYSCQSLNVSSSQVSIFKG